MTASSDATYTISQIAEALDVSARTIRFYEEKGLITPKGRLAFGDAKLKEIEHESH